MSDIHANLVALEAVLADAGECDAVWNLGDTVGYGPRPRECLDKMVDLFANPVLVGNHDLACIGEVDINEFNPVAQLAARWTALQLGMDHRAYLNALPAVTIAGPYTLAHGSPRSPVWEYVTSAQIATENFEFYDTDTCFIGHTHIAMYALLRDGQDVAEISTLEPGQQLVADDKELGSDSLLPERLLDRGLRVAVEVLGLKIRADALHMLVLGSGEHRNRNCSSTTTLQ